MNPLNQSSQRNDSNDSIKSINKLNIYVDLLFGNHLFRWRFFGKRSISLTFFGKRSISLTFLGYFESIQLIQSYQSLKVNRLSHILYENELTQSPINSLRNELNWFNEFCGKMNWFKGISNCKDLKIWKANRCISASCRWSLTIPCRAEVNFICSHIY